MSEHDNFINPDAQCDVDASRFAINDTKEVQRIINQVRATHERIWRTTIPWVLPTCAIYSAIGSFFCCVFALLLYAYESQPFALDLEYIPPEIPGEDGAELPEDQADLRRIHFSKVFLLVSIMYLTLSIGLGWTWRIKKQHRQTIMEQGGQTIHELNHRGDTPTPSKLSGEPIASSGIESHPVR